MEQHVFTNPAGEVALVNPLGGLEFVPASNVETLVHPLSGWRYATADEVVIGAKVIRDGDGNVFMVTDQGVVSVGESNALALKKLGARIATKAEVDAHTKTATIEQQIVASVWNLPIEGWLGLGVGLSVVAGLILIAFVKMIAGGRKGATPPAPPRAS